MQILHIHRYLTQNILGCINATKEVAQIKIFAVKTDFLFVKNCERSAKVLIDIKYRFKKTSERHITAHIRIRFSTLVQRLLNFVSALSRNSNCAISAEQPYLSKNMS